MITTLYAAILGLFYVGLSAYVIKSRFKNQVSLGDGECDDLRKRVRVHGNFIEYVPIALILLFLAEQEGVSEWMMHTMGIALVLARVMHATGLSRKDGTSVGRAGGMMITFLVITVASLLCLKSYFLF